MKRRIVYVCVLALLLTAYFPALAGSGAASGNPPPSRVAAPPPPLVQEPVLNTIAGKIKATADFSEAVYPGRLLNVTLVLPSELGGPLAFTGAPGMANRTSAAVSQRGPADAAAGPTNTIPCRLWTCGCPGPLSLGSGVVLDQFELRVTWDIFELVNGNRVELKDGEDYQSPSAAGLSRAFVLAPLHVVEYTGEKPPASAYFITATVTVVANKIVTLPPSTTQVTSAPTAVDVPLSLLALEVPKVFVLFLDNNFGGAAAIYFPKSTVFQGSSDNAQAKIFEGAGRILDTYNTSVTRLGFVAWFASYMTGLEELRKVRDLPHVDVKERKDSEKNLNDDDFIHRPWYSSLNDTEVEDESSSLLLLGPPGSGGQFFQDRSFKGGEFDVLTGAPRVAGGNKPPLNYAPAILVRDFKTVETSEPAGKVTIVKTFGTNKNPNDRVSSFRWVQ